MRRQSHWNRPVVLQVADALDDKGFNKMFKLTVTTLRRYACNRSEAPDPQHISSGLSKLPHHLQQRVLAKLAETFCKNSGLLVQNASLQVLAPAIATLTSLQSISLGTDSFSYEMDFLLDACCALQIRRCQRR